jgi:hypothetical protein
MHRYGRCDRDVATRTSDGYEARRPSSGAACPFRICLAPWATQISAVAGAVGPTAASSSPSERLFRASGPPSRPTALPAVGGFGSFATGDLVARRLRQDERLGVETGHLIGIRCRFGDLGIGLLGAHGDFPLLCEPPLASDPAARLLPAPVIGILTHPLENTNLACVRTVVMGAVAASAARSTRGSRTG